MSDCIFCKIIKGEIPADKVYEDKNALAFLDITPVNPGHILLVPKKHFKNLYDLPDSELKNLAPILKKLAIATKNAVDASGINIHMNNEKSAGQLVAHAHFHIIPRFSYDGYRHWHGQPYKEGESQQVAKKIKKFL
ncbi:MAG: HIT family protein [Patescibacteria group bacterium]